MTVNMFNSFTTTGSFLIPFITTHPNVSISVFRQTIEIGADPQNEFSKVLLKHFKFGWQENQLLFANSSVYKVFNSSAKTEHSRWSYDPRKGLTLRNPTPWDSSIYYVAGYLPFANGKSVYIKHEEKNLELLSWLFPPDELNSTDVNRVPVILAGNWISFYSFNAHL